jgi:hypothetical protein
MLLWAILFGVLAWALATLLFLALVYAYGDGRDQRTRV